MWVCGRASRRELIFYYSFDSGGISIKPSAGMAMMKGDMGGAAVALATMVGVGRWESRSHVV